MLTNLQSPRLNLRNRHFVILDVAFFLLTPTLALGLRVSLPWRSGYFEGLIVFIFLSLLIKMGICILFRLYSRYWRYASINELITIAFSVLATTIVITVVYWSSIGLRWISQPLALPRSVPFIDGLLTVIFIGGSRFSIRVVDYWRARDHRIKQGKRVLIIGAGDAGELVVREMIGSRHISLDPVGFVDDDPQKIGMAIHGVPVLGSINRIPELIKLYSVDEVVIAIPTASGSLIRSIVSLCQTANVPSRIVPGIYEILNGRVGIDRLRKVEIDDLLRREPVQVSTDNVSRMLDGKRVLVTGAGGSIGSELCRQILKYRPAQLILLGHGENSLFSVHMHLLKLRGELGQDLTCEIRIAVADVRNRSRLQAVFSRYLPEIVFHAAAHKHVPLMEENPEEAVTNNVLGTLNVMEISQQVRVERFVFISTDKAVNPVNIMGMTKHVAEMIVRLASEISQQPYVSVRFGNVLGSRGSVVPIFQEQIANGGPVTITHPEITRFFMTIPEAVQLVLQAAAMGIGGEVYVLDMGEPVKIVDLVHDMIELSGYHEGIDIDIIYTGLRPGEKLHEELFMVDEKPARTEHEKIFVARVGGIPDRTTFDQSVYELIKYAQAGDTEATRQKLFQIACGSYFPQKVEMTLDG